VCGIKQKSSKLLLETTTLVSVNIVGCDREFVTGGRSFVCVYICIYMVSQVAQSL
jgi:hypothetical protein